MATRKLEISAQKAIKFLRKKKLRQGLPFMINSDILDSKQCFMEYPDGSIKIVEANPKEFDFLIIYEFNAREADDLRKRLNLI